MPKNTELDLEYECYKNWDMSNAKPARLNPMIAKLQENARLANAQSEKLLEEDVATWLIKQDTKTKHHVNELIRQAMALQTVKFA